MQNIMNIFCKLELIKKHKKLMINLHLNQQANNIEIDGQTISWSPTKEEMNFLYETLDLLKQKDIQNTIIFHKNSTGSSPIHTFTDDEQKTRNEITSYKNNDEPYEAIDRIINKQ